MLREFLAQMLLDLSLALLSFALYLRRSEFLGCISQAQLDSGWAQPKKGTEEKMEGGRVREAKVFVPSPHSGSIFGNTCFSHIA